jgi:plastocyanin
MQTDPRRGPRVPLLAVTAATMLLLAACGGATPSTSASAGASSATTARCSVTPDASPSATIEISGSQFGDEVNVSAGQAVAFVNKDTIDHTVTEGTNGTAVADACVDEPIEAGETEVVTFTEAGDYDITCTIHSSMQTAVHVS